jgi:hypothetical protein
MISGSPTTAEACAVDALDQLVSLLLRVGCGDCHPEISLHYRAPLSGSGQ